jgi:hypothetical protein
MRAELSLLSLSIPAEGRCVIAGERKPCATIESGKRALWTKPCAMSVIASRERGHRLAQM